MINLALSVGVDCAAVHLLACGSLLECGSGLPSLSTFNTPGRGALIGVEWAAARACTTTSVQPPLGEK
jgi:hypothetical protein